MNYRHAFHAGNAADCLKHAVLVWVLRALARKDKPFFVLDTHAGVGRYDLDDVPARRTGEASRGIFRLLDDPPGPLADYVSVVREIGLYPGSPAIVAALLRPGGAVSPDGKLVPGSAPPSAAPLSQRAPLCQGASPAQVAPLSQGASLPQGASLYNGASLSHGDRAVACELHPEDAGALRRNFRGNAQMSVHQRDGYAAVGAFLPPPERRGLTLIDPPYEEPGEYERVVAAIKEAHRRFASGVILAWYPIKHRAPVRALHDAIRGASIPDVMAAEMFLREPLDAARLNGSGLIVVNPPFRFEAGMAPILAALLQRLGDRETGEGTALLRLAPESGGR